MYFVFGMGILILFALLLCYLSLTQEADAAQLDAASRLTNTPEAYGAEAEGLTILVRGSRYACPNGFSRQVMYKRLEPGMELQLTPEPRNPVDPRAVAVERIAGGERMHLGYLPEDFALRMSEELARGLEYKCEVKCLVPDKYHTASLCLLINLVLG